MSINMQDIIDTITEMRIKELEFKEKEKQMGNRALVSGTQLGMVIGFANSVKKLTESVIPTVNTPKEIISKCESINRTADGIIDEMRTCLEKQHIGYSKNLLADDVNVHVNLHASWIGSTGEENG